LFKVHKKTKENETGQCVQKLLNHQYQTTTSETTNEPIAHAEQTCQTQDAFPLQSIALLVYAGVSTGTPRPKHR